MEFDLKATGDAVTGWKVMINDGVNEETWTPPGAFVEDVVVTAIHDHVAKFGHAIPVLAPPASRPEDVAEIARLNAEIERLKDAVPKPDAEMPVDHDAEQMHKVD